MIPAPNVSLLHRVARGDAGAVSDCIHRYGPLVWSLARRYTRSVAEAEDGAQDVFVALWRGASRFDPLVASEMAFVSMTARRQLIDRHRRAARQSAIEQLAAAPAVHGSGARFEACGEAVLAEQALAELQPEQRQVLLLAACRGMSHSEIAGVMNIPLDTVKTHARHGLMHIRARLGSHAPAQVYA